MKNDKKKFARLSFQAACFVLLFLSFLFFRGSTKIALGLGDSATSNVAGWAWSSNFKWISMNCSNTGTCAAVNYGVNINRTSEANSYNLSGHAWSSAVGWISFEYDAGDPTPPDNWNFASTTAYCYNLNCKNGAGSCSACFNPLTGKIYGWARVMRLGDEGWISLGTTSKTGISINQTVASGTFTGFGWNGNTYKQKGMGWMSFNCNDPHLGNTCAASNYSVYLKGHSLPAPTNLSAPNWTFSNACNSELALNAILEWNNGATIPMAWEVIVSTSTATSSPPAYDTGKRFGNVSQFVFHASSTNNIVRYDKAYYWWLKIWDDFGFVSGWRQFNVGAGDTLTDNAVRNAYRGNAKTFTSYLHEFPWADFTYVPTNPLAYNPVTSTDASVYFSTSSPSTPTACNKTHCAWYWTGGTYILTNSATTSSSTVMTFKYSNGINANITLKVTNKPTSTSDMYSCVSTTPNFLVDLLPFWKEKKSQ